MTDHVTHVTHPLVQHKLTLMRQKDTSTAAFRQLLREISQLLAYEVTRGLPMTTKRIETPMQEMDAPTLDGKKLALISILRAGNGLMDGVLELIPSARVGFVAGQIDGAPSYVPAKPADTGEAPRPAGHQARSGPVIP